MSEQHAAATSEKSVSRTDAAREWVRIGLLSFGGPAAQIALMHRVIVEERRWLSEQQFLNALSFCMLLPGPEAMQLATYSGWRLHGVAGGLIAGLLFVLPGAVVIMALAIIYAYFGQVPLVAAIFLGVKAAVLVIVVDALLKVAKRALVKIRHWIIAALAFVCLFALQVPFPLIVLGAGLLGFLFTNASPEQKSDTDHNMWPKPAQTLRTIFVWLVLWWAPLLLIVALFGGSILTDLGWFFSKLAVVTFGGAYAVLAYMAQDVVTQFGWLSAGAMMDGLGLAETTPGPLILVTQFVGFLSAFQSGGLVLGIAGALVTLWVTFTPCFLWIFAGAPYIEWISGQPRLKGALAAISAAVVGVILNLSVWLTLHVFFSEVSAETLGPFVMWQPQVASLQWQAVILALVAAILLLKLRWNLLTTLLTAAVLGVAISAVG